MKGRGGKEEKVTEGCRATYTADKEQIHFVSHQGGDGKVSLTLTCLEASKQAKTAFSSSFRAHWRLSIVSVVSIVSSLSPPSCLLSEPLNKAAVQQRWSDTAAIITERSHYVRHPQT